MTKFSSKKNQTFWDEFALKSKNNTFGASGGRHLVEIENKFIFKNLKLQKPKNLLDIGCGNGQRTINFSKFSKKTLGIDYSSQMIFEAKKLVKNKKMYEKTSFEVFDVNKFPDKESFDQIISCRCIINQTSTNNQVKLFKKLHKILKPGGSIILTEISKQGIKNLNDIRKKYDLPPMTKRWHNLHIDEKKVFPEIKKLFNVKDLQRAGTFYFLSRVIYPALILPKEPEPESKMNKLSLISDVLLKNRDSHNSLENFGAHLMMNLIKK
jgi:cyclopropane fatty-acyl-phospholipid synthase-like methyltransferase